MCRHICRRSGSLVLSIDYALAPEHPFPAAPDDCLAAVRWVVTHAAQFGGDAARLAVAGDSAGGNLATVTALRLRDEGNGPKLRAQLLMYPVVDHYSARHPSYEERREGLSLTRDDMIWFWNHYLPDLAWATSPQVSPLRAASLKDLPPAFIITAEYDVLRDEGEAYATRLRADGVPTEQRRYTDANHGFMFWVDLIESATQAMDEACAWLKARLA
jgi:acetyl esterase